MVEKDKVFINIAEENYGVKIPNSYIEAYRDLHKNHNILSYTFYIGTKESSKNYDFHKSICCKNKKDILRKIKKISFEKEVIFINTFTEQLIDICNQVKKELGEEITIHEDSFRDKSQQRKLLQDFNLDLGIKFLNYTFETIDSHEIIEHLGFPFIVKPSSGIQSAGVAIIQSKTELNTYLKDYQGFLEKFKARGFSNNSLVFEEFIDGEMFSVDYFVDKLGKIISTPPVEVKIGTDIGVQDFMNYVRSFRSNAIDKIENKNLQEFIEGSVSALGIKNTFIHHEFKLTSKGKLKTIEINGRIGGFRLEMIQQALSFNWLSVIVGNIPSNYLKNNFASFLIYPQEKSILEGFNNKRFDDISKLRSIFSINKIMKFVGREIGLTNQGFTKVAIIKIKNSDAKQFEKDFNFIEEHYKDLLMVRQ